MESSDEDLMRRAQQGERFAFEQLVTRYRDSLSRFARSKLRERQVAEDVVQEALLAAYAARQTFNPEYSFRTWLWTITVNLCYREWKRNRRPSAAGTVDPSRFDTLADANPSGLESVLNDERSDRLHRALAALPEAQGDALRLRFFGGLRFDEIAVAMESSVSGAKQRVKLGLQRLSELLRDLSGVES